MNKRKVTEDTSPYSKIFEHQLCASSNRMAANQLLAFTAYFDAEGNKMSNEELLDRIVGLALTPHSIFQDNKGYLLRFELDKPIDIESEEHEKKLQQRILKFLEENKVVIGKLQEMEIGKWEAHLVLLDDEDEVLEWL